MLISTIRSAAGQLAAEARSAVRSGWAVLLVGGIKASARHNAPAAGALVQFADSSAKCWMRKVSCVKTAWKSGSVQAHQTAVGQHQSAVAACVNRPFISAELMSKIAQSDGWRQTAGRCAASCSPAGQLAPVLRSAVVTGFSRSRLYPHSNYSIINGLHGAPSWCFIIILLGSLITAGQTIEAQPGFAG